MHVTMKEHISDKYMTLNIVILMSFQTLFSIKNGWREKYPK
jgi:hypothetical protein